MIVIFMSSLGYPLRSYTVGAARHAARACFTADGVSGDPRALRSQMKFLLSAAMPSAADGEPLGCFGLGT